MPLPLPLPLPKPPSPAAKAAQPARRSQAARREEAEQRLLDAALHIVATRGSVRMTLAEVGEAAGYSRGLPAHRFGNKAGLVHALAAHIGERFGEQRARGPSPPPEPGLAAILANIHFYFSRQDGAFTATRALLVMMTESCMAPTEALRDEMAAYNRSALAWFEHHVRVGMQRGEIGAQHDAAASAVVLLGAMRGVMLQWLVDPQIKLPAVRDQLLQLVGAQLAAAPGSAARPAAKSAAKSAKKSATKPASKPLRATRRASARPP